MASSIKYQVDSRSGNTYAYRVDSEWDPVSNKKVFKRVYLGRVDILTGNIIPKATEGKRNRSISDKQIDKLDNKTKEGLNNQKELIQELKQSVEELQKKCLAGEELANKLRTILAEYDQNLQ